MCRPYGTPSRSPGFPGLTSWANIFRPSGAGSLAMFQSGVPRNVLLSNQTKVRAVPMNFAMSFLAA
jgi:hypothetical protein